MWSMPDKVLRYAAAGILICAVLGFTLGVTGAGPRTRLPGEQLGPVSDSEASAASDALPINLEETPPPKAEEPAEQVEETPDEAADKPPEPVAPPPAKVAEAPPPPQAAPPPASAEPSAPPAAKDEPLY